jgi:hypothetical protein
MWTQAISLTLALSSALHETSNVRDVELKEGDNGEAHAIRTRARQSAADAHHSSNLLLRLPRVPQVIEARVRHRHDGAVGVDGAERLRDTP